MKQVAEIKERGSMLSTPRLSKNGGRAAHNNVDVRLTGARRFLIPRLSRFSGRADHNNVGVRLTEASDNRGGKGDEYINIVCKIT